MGVAEAAEDEAEAAAAPAPEAAETEAAPTAAELTPLNARIEAYF